MPSSSVASQTRVCPSGSAATDGSMDGRRSIRSVPSRSTSTWMDCTNTAPKNVLNHSRAQLYVCGSAQHSSASGAIASSASTSANRISIWPSSNRPITR